MRPFPIALASLIGGLAVALLADGAVRGLAGDVLIIVFLVASAAALGLGTATGRVLGVCTLALSLELFQLLDLVGPGAPLFIHLVLGSTFDPLDLVAYGLGAALAVVLERHWLVLARPRFRHHNPNRRSPSGGEITS